MHFMEALGAPRWEEERLWGVCFHSNEQLCFAGFMCDFLWTVLFGGGGGRPQL